MRVSSFLWCMPVSRVLSCPAICLIGLPFRFGRVALPHCKQCLPDLFGLSARKVYPRTELLACVVGSYLHLFTLITPKA